jgi:hypothetical protein
MDSNAVIMK